MTIMPLILKKMRLNTQIKTLQQEFTVIVESKDKELKQCEFNHDLLNFKVYITSSIELSDKLTFD